MNQPGGRINILINPSRQLLIIDDRTYRFSNPRAIKTIRLNGCKFVPRTLSIRRREWKYLARSPPYFYPPSVARQLLRCARRVVFSRHPIKLRTVLVVDIGFIACAHRSHARIPCRFANLAHCKRKLCPLSINFSYNSVTPDKQTRFVQFTLLRAHME